MEREPIFVICTKGEYAFLQEHLQEIFDVLSQEVLIPYDYMRIEKIDGIIEDIAANPSPLDEALVECHFTINYDQTQSDDSKAKAYALARWLFSKENYSKRTMKMANRAFILENVNCENTDLDEQEKQDEIRFWSLLKRMKIDQIERIDAKQFVHQKTR